MARKATPAKKTTPAKADAGAAVPEGNQKAAAADQEPAAAAQPDPKAGQAAPAQAAASPKAPTASKDTKETGGSKTSLVCRCRVMSGEKIFEPGMVFEGSEEEAEELLELGALEEVPAD